MGVKAKAKPTEELNTSILYVSRAIKKGSLGANGNNISCRPRPGNENDHPQHHSSFIIVLHLCFWNIMMACGGPRFSQPNSKPQPEYKENSFFSELTKPFCRRIGSQMRPSCVFTTQQRGNGAIEHTHHAAI